MGAAADTPDDLVFDFFQESAFPGQPIGRPILGTIESVRAQTPALLRDYMAKHYLTGRMTVSAAGAVDHEQVVNEVGQRLAKAAIGQAPAIESARYSGGVKLGARDLEQAHLVLGLEGRSYPAPDIYPMQVFANLLGGGMSSRLFQEVRGKRGLCSSMSG